MKKLENIIIINKYKLSKIDQKIISSIKNFISTSKFKNDYNFKHRLGMIFIKIIPKRKNKF
jgi:hypothetical protein